MTAEEQEQYCGFVCDDWLEKVQNTLDEVKEFSQYNREFALVMIGKMRNMAMTIADDISRA